MSSVSFYHGQNPILGRGLKGNWIFRGIGSGRGFLSTFLEGRALFYLMQQYLVFAAAVGIFAAAQVIFAKQRTEPPPGGIVHLAEFGPAIFRSAANKGKRLIPTGQKDETVSANTYDFGRSFLRWTSTKNNHTPRLQVDAACTLIRDGKSKEYFLSAICTGEQMYADKELIHLPAYEFAMVCAPKEEYMFFKWYAASAFNVIELHRVGETMTTHDGRGTPITEMSVHMAHHTHVRPLTTYGEIREAILADKVLNARTEYLGEDGKTRVIMNYPVKICNIALGRERWQVDTPVLLPDLAAQADLPVGVFRMGYIVSNSWDWAEVILRRPGSTATGKSSFTESRRLMVKNQLFCAE